MDTLKIEAKTDGISTLSSSEWNSAVTKINDIVGEVNKIPAIQAAITNTSNVVSVESTADKEIINVANVKFAEITDDGFNKSVALCGENDVNVGPSDNGSVSIQPKGLKTLAPGYEEMNKIHFTHGGGAGLEFGTFDTQNTSLFTDNYRFNKDGKILLSTRQVISRSEGNDLKDINDVTTWNTYVKQDDGFYDIISDNDPSNVTWGDLVKFIAWAKDNSFGPWA